MKNHKPYPYNPELKEKARYLRNNSTLSEVLLWNELKNKKMKGLDFHRQKPLLSYIVDFFCPEIELVIEIDGNTHDLKETYDRKRQNEIEALGIRFIRFTDQEIKKDMPNVLRAIEVFILENQ